MERRREERRREERRGFFGQMEATAVLPSRP